VNHHVMERYIYDGGIYPHELKEFVRQATVENKFVPVMCGTALKNKGVKMVLDAVVEYMPSPLDVPPMKATDLKSDKAVELEPEADAPTCAFTYKIQNDPYVGNLAFVRVYSGTIKAGTYLYNATVGKKERIGQIVRMHADQREMIESCGPGSIVGIPGLKHTTTAHTLCDERHQMVLEKIKYPEPVISMAIEPDTKADQDRLSEALRRVEAEDPTFLVKYNEETGQTLISGMGELHLEIIVDRLKREFNVTANVGSPQVAYRETVKKLVKATGKFIQQTGGHGQYGHVEIELGPAQKGSGIVFEENIKGGAIPREYFKAIKEGIISSAKSGVLAGYPVTDIKVVLYDGSYHEVDSSELAFNNAASIALREGMSKANTVLLEPIMDLEVTTPDDYLGDVIGDMNARRIKIESIEQKGSAKIVRGNAPLATMFGYATALRSLTQGRATYTMEPAFYQEVPKELIDKIIMGGGISH